MAYENHNGSMTDKLCLYGESARDYMRVPIGETVKLTVTALLKGASLMSPDSVEDGEMPCVEFEVLDVEGGKKPYSEMSNAEMEGEIHNAKYEDQPEEQAVSTVPNIESGGSVWTDKKREDKVARKPMGRIRPFGYR